MNQVHFKVREIREAVMGLTGWSVRSEETLRGMLSISVWGQMCRKQGVSSCAQCC